MCYIPRVIQLWAGGGCLFVVLQDSDCPLDYLTFMIKEDVITEGWKAYMAN